MNIMRQLCAVRFNVMQFLLHTRCTSCAVCILALWLILLSGASANPASMRNLIANAGFEEVRDGQPTGWSIHDKISTLSHERVHTGNWALKIVDTNERDGSSVTSQRFAVKPGKRYAVWLWSYLESGKPGLGVYVRFWDERGRELVEARERQIHVAAMVKGKWVPTFFLVDVPPEAKQIAVWLHTFSKAVLTCYVDDVRLIEFERGALEEAEAWSGGIPDTDVVKVGKFSVRWAHGECPAIRMSFKEPQDWSKYSAVSFWLHSQRATNSAFMLIVRSENERTKGMDYYPFRIVLNWTGWRHFILPFRELGRAREPIGWHKIDSVTFTASGWGNEPHPDAVVRLDGFELTHVKMEGPRMSDEEFFNALNLKMPQLEAVKEAVERGDYMVAKRALARHIRERTYPRWFFDWRDHPFRGVKVPPPEADRAPDQWDYFSRYITIDWEGWRHFSLKKGDFSPRAFVEGKGWRGKKPIGWHWIRYMQFSARGWGLKPHPNAVLYFDDIRLVGKNKSVVICDFESERHPFEGLERTDERAKQGRFSGKWASQLVTGSIRCWKIPHDWSEFDALEFWVYSEKATGSRIILVLDSDAPKVRSAEDYVQKKFTWNYGNQPWTVQFKDKINWAANPTKGAARTHLWNEALNRHFHFRTLARAYWETGNERYAKALVEHWMDWIKSNPRPLLSSGNRPADGNYAWQTLTTGIRLESTWPEAFYRCLGSPAFTDEVIVTIMKSIAEQARHLIQHPTGGNWLTEESMGLFTAGMLFPEFKEAKEWRRIAIQRLYKQLDEEVYPDGMEYELAAGYNNWVVSNFCNLIERADLNDLRGELPRDFVAKLEKMFNYLLYAMMPNGAIPGLNDSGNADVRALLMRGYKLFPQRKDFLFGATLGASGERPRQASCAFHYAGHYVMRSGWDADAIYLLFDSGPFGYGHQHEDKLHFVLWAYGKQHILDPGNYSYDRSKWRRYIITTPGHNTIMVDGHGQNRRRKRETYVWAKPWDKPKPPGNDTVWLSESSFDFVRGSYRDGYGLHNEIKVTHTRRIIFVKPEYFVVQDTLTPADENEHAYESLFHIDAENATVDNQTLMVMTHNENASNIAIVPLADEGLQVRIVKGQEEPVQGWANHPWRAIPTAIFTKRGKGIVKFVYVLYPVRRGERIPITAVERIRVQPVDANAIAVAIKFTDGRTDYILFNDSPGTQVKFANFISSAEAMCIRTNADGKVTGKFATMQ